MNLYMPRQCSFIVLHVITFACSWSSVCPSKLEQDYGEKIKQKH